MKKIIMLSAAFLVTIMVAVSVVAGFVAILSGEESAQEVSMNQVESSTAEEFLITGTAEGNTLNLTLTSQRFGYTVDDVKINVTGRAGTVTTYVKMPVLTGTRQDKAWQWLLQNGFTKEGAAAVMASIEAESAGTWQSRVEEGSTTEYQGKTALNQGYGLFQWTNWRNPTNGNTSWRRRDVIDYLESRGIDPIKDSDEAFFAELEYAINEKPEIMKRVKTSTSVSEATKIMTYEFERPANMEAANAGRTRVAKTYYEDYYNVSAYSETKKESVPLTVKYEAKSLKDSSSGYEAPTWDEKKRMGEGIIETGGTLLTSAVKINFEGLINSTPIAGTIGLGIGQVGETLIATGLAVKNAVSIEKALWQLKAPRSPYGYGYKGLDVGSGGYERFAGYLAEDGKSVPFAGDKGKRFKVTSFHGYRCISTYNYERRLHQGVDMRPDDNSVGGYIYPIYSGTVVALGWYVGYGNVVVIQSTEEDGMDITLFYAHLSKIDNIHVEQYVTKVWPIGREGNTGGNYAVHLHVGQGYPKFSKEINSFVLDTLIATYGLGYVDYSQTNADIQDCRNGG